MNKYTSARLNTANKKHGDTEKLKQELNCLKAMACGLHFGCWVLILMKMEEILLGLKQEKLI